MKSSNALKNPFKFMRMHFRELQLGQELERSHACAESVVLLCEHRSSALVLASLTSPSKSGTGASCTNPELSGHPGQGPRESASMRRPSYFREGPHLLQAPTRQGGDKKILVSSAQPGILAWGWTVPKAPSPVSPKIREAASLGGKEPEGGSSLI